METDVHILKNEMRKLRQELKAKEQMLCEMTEQYDNVAHELSATVKEFTRNKNSINETFIVLLDTYISLKDKVIPFDSKTRKDEYYMWMERAGLFE